MQCGVGGRARRRTLRVMLVLAPVWLAVACSEGSESPPADAASTPPEPPPSQKERVLGPFLFTHWRLPVPPQGPPPEGWGEAEASLDSATCGACHPKQYSEWKASRHAGAWSPGFRGQLIEGALANPTDIEQCQTCHAPLSEQLSDADLRRQGVVCAGCHVRAHARYGPPPRPDAPPVPEPRPHGGFVVRPEYEQSRFCAPCHQLFDDVGVAGKPIENTWVEWRASPQAEAGRTCQACHMPDRAHVWRGIHDPEMVRSAVDVQFEAASLGASLEAALVLANRDVGHAFPTYATPRVFLAVWQQDADGVELPGTHAELVIGREIDLAAAREDFDTRVLPGAEARLAYARERASGAAALVARAWVEPDWHYERVFTALLDEYRSPEARAAIREARDRTRESDYVLAEFQRPLPALPATEVSEARGAGDGR